WMFYHWVQKNLGHDGSFHNWDGILLEAVNGDEAAALDLFFEEFDRFQKVSISRHFILQPNEEARAHFSEYMMRKRPDLVNQPSMPVPAMELEAYSYAPGFGCALYERRSETLAVGSYFPLESELAQWMEDNYGIDISW
ncbi:MAG: hypothetical protein AAF206_31055, partial [Bacteroidota bacterium]